VVVNEAWNREGAVSNPLGSMWNNLVNCKTRLKEWSRSKFADDDRQIATLSKRLERLQNAEHLGNLATIKQVHGDLNKLLEMEDMKWRQRAKRNWFVGGDRNTQFFHSWANQRRRSNFIGSTKDMAGMEWSTLEQIGEAFKGYFQ